MILRAPHPDVVVRGQPVSAYRVYGTVGLGVALATTAWLAHLTLSLWVWGALAVAGVLGFVLLAAATRLVRRADSLTYYHHHTLVVVVSAALLAGLGQPVARGLDLAVVALGIFLAFGRVGCFSVGCCHGRPGRAGVRYRQAHADGGFPACFVDVPLLPVQLLEAAGVGTLAVMDVVLIARGAPAGLAFVAHSLGYAVMRFGLEPLRGDSARGHRLGSSEAQWTAALWTAVTTGVAAIGWLPWRGWFVAAPIVIAVGLLFRALRPAPLHSPRHLRQLAELQASLRSAARPGIGTTSLGLRLSASRVQDGGRDLDLYALSCSHPLHARDVRRLADLLARVGRYAQPPELVPGQGGVLHLIFERSEHAL